MIQKLHQKLLQKSPLYAKWHKNPFHRVVHFIIVIILLIFFATYLSFNLNYAAYNNFAYNIVSASEGQFITRISPNSIIAGNSDFILTVSSNGLFTTHSTVLFHGLARTTTYISPYQITAYILASDVKVVQVSNIEVVDSSSQEFSNPLSFTVYNALITNISPSSVIAGDLNLPLTGLPLTVTGVGFSSTSLIDWNGYPLETAHPSSTMLTANIPVSELTTGKTINITVSDPLIRGGGTSSAVQFTIKNPQPFMSYISPASTPIVIDSGTLATGDIPINIYGTKFTRTSVVKFGASILKPDYIDSTHLKIDVARSHFNSAQTVSVRVINPAPGGGTYNDKVFSIENPHPVIIEPIIPNSALISTAGYSLNIDIFGKGFVKDSYIVTDPDLFVHHMNVYTQFISPTHLRADIRYIVRDVPINSDPSFYIKVFNPYPGGGFSNRVIFIAHLLYITSVSPASILSNDSTTNVVINGHGFIGDLDKFQVTLRMGNNGYGLMPVVNSSQQLTFTIPSEFKQSGKFDLEIYRYSSDNQPAIATNSIDFTIKPASTPIPIIINLDPFITNINPSVIMVGSEVSTLIVHGANFVDGAVVKLNANGIDSIMTTEYVSDIQLKASIPVKYLERPEKYNITVTNPVPQGGTSNAVSLNVVSE